MSNGRSHPKGNTVATSSDFKRAEKTYKLKGGTSWNFKGSISRCGAQKLSAAKHAKDQH